MLFAFYITLQQGFAPIVSKHIAMHSWYAFLNSFFFVFHTVFTLFNCIGWAVPSWRKWHLITMLLTAFSWFVLGIWHGWGYCVCTDWHYTVRTHLGLHDQQGSYIRFLINKLFGVDFNEQLVENATLIVFLCCLALSLFLNIRDYRRKKGTTSNIEHAS